MDNQWIFNHSSNLEIVEEKIDRVGLSRGYKALMAEAAGCQPAYLSQVLSGRALLTIEQASGLADFWQFNNYESDYFITLAQYARAGTLSLQSKLEKRLSEIKQSVQKKNKSELQLDTKRVTMENALQYYADWLPSAVHMLLSLERFNKNTVSLAGYLHVTEAEIYRAIEVLLQLGFIKKDNNGFSKTSKHLHISQQNLYSNLHHRNWRLKAIDKLQNPSAENLHFTSIYSLDSKTHQYILKKIRSLLTEVKREVSEAEETRASGLNIDFFEV